MQVIILAGGKGTRLRPLTYSTAKPMIPIHKKPFLEYLLILVKSFDLKDIVILAGYLANQIEAYFNDGKKFGLNIKYSYEKKLLGTGGALKNAADKLANEFLLLNGDTFLPINYEELIRYFYKNNKLGVITAYSNKDQVALNNMLVGEGNLVIDYNKKDSLGKTHVDAGVMIFKKEILENIPETQVCSLENEVYKSLIIRKQLLAFPTDQRFYDMGSPERLKKISEVLK